MSDSNSSVEQNEAPPANGRAAADARQDGSSGYAKNAPPSGSEDKTIISGRSPTASPASSTFISRMLEGCVLPGDRLGHFDLVEYVGGGGMGRVFRAVDTQLGRTVALKILPPDQAAEADGLQRFQNEAHSTARLDHDNIVRAYYVGEDCGLHFIVFEFIDGANIRSLLERKGPLPLEEALSYTLQIAEALAHAEAREVVHRDIKPSNVLVTPEGRVKLIDMGLARLRQADPAVADLTASGVTLGTFDYISPEQARDPRNADIRSDIYSLGCTVFFMLTGQPPFPQGTVLQKLLQHQGDEPPDIRQFRPELPDELGRVLRKMMAKDRAQRYAGPAELLDDLLLLAQQIGLRPVSPSSRIWLLPHDAPDSFFQRHLPWIASVAVLVCIVVLLDLSWSLSASREGQSPPTSLDMADAMPNHASPRGTSAASETFRQPTDGAVDASTRRTSTSGGSPQAGGGISQTEASRDFSDTDEAATDLLPHTPASMGEPIASSESAKRSRPLVVSSTPRGDHQFSTLEGACAAARDGDVIELRFDGAREERPIKMYNLGVTIRAGEGYRPLVVFRPTDGNPVKHPHSMFTLTSGHLTLMDVAVALDVPRGVPADEWSLFETEGGQMVHLERCCLTVRNASDHGSTYHPDVAFFRARSELDGDGFIGGFRAATPLSTLELIDCLVRGEADLLRVDDPQAVSLLWDNGMFLSSGRLLAAGGSQSAPTPDEMLRIELRHVTVAARGGLCRLGSTFSNPYQLAVQLVSSDSVLIVPAGVPLIEQDGAANVEDSRQRFVWNGDRTFYQDVDEFWAVRSLDGETPADVMDIEAWKAYWGPSRENQPSTERLQWKQPREAEGPLHAQGPDDYTLEDPTFGDASAGAPGCRVDRLPSLPVEPDPQRPRRPASTSSTGLMRAADRG